MGSLSVVHWIIYLLVLALVIYPFWRILSRMGLPGVLSLLVIIPVVNLVFLWVVAFIAWPRDKAQT